MKRIISFLKVKVISLLVLAVFITINFLSCSDENTSPIQSTGNKEITVGALLSLTGDWSSLGKASEAALNIATKDINNYLASISSNIRLKLKIEDTKLDTTIALQKIKSLSASGVRFIIGPQSSKEVSAIKKFADQNNILVLSQGSTAGNLAIPGDNIFRFCPSDSIEGAAIAQLMWSEGMKTYIPFGGNDAGNQGLQIAAKASFINLGGTVTQGVVYDPATVNFASYLQTIRAEILQQQALYGKAGVGVYITGFDAVINIFKQAITDTVLNSVKWYGSDGMVLNEKLIADTTAARFAEMTKYPCPTYGLDQSNKFKWQPIVNQIESEIGYQPDAFGLAAYDALWIVAIAYLSIDGADDFQFLKKVFQQTANSYYGLTGATTLNNAGDRMFGYYAYWGVRKQGDVYKWVLLD
ncbi:MAG: penicillin-binding protein activator [Ignavibacteriales bacterium]|nr:penicillin-binding protein activator [Ignavibacteriales bacterium]